MLFLSIFDVDMEHYNKGGDMISFFLGPATVALAVPLYKQLPLLKKNLLSILAGVTSGCIVALTSVWVLGDTFGVSSELTLSILPKSVTTPIGVELSSQIGGIPEITVGMILVAGILGAVIGPSICRYLKIKNSVAVGIAIGTSSHALGTTKAMELGETQGAMSSLSIGLAGLITVLITPLFLALF